MSKVTITTKVLTAASPEHPPRAAVGYTGSVKIQLSKDQNFTIGVTSTSALTPNQYGYIKTTSEGLDSNTQYYARISSYDGTTADNNTIAKFKTPPSGNHSFKFGFGSCLNNKPHNGNGGQARVLRNIKEKAEKGDIEFFYMLGDWDYNDIATNDVNLFYDSYHERFNGTTASRQLGFYSSKDCWASMPLYFMNDDHDSGPNDGYKDSPAKPAAIETFRNVVPGPTLANLSGTTSGVYYSFTRGRVRFVATDNRNERTQDNSVSNPKRPNDPSQYILSDQQEQWFKDQISQAATGGQAVIWVNSIAWVGPGAATGAPDDPRPTGATYDYDIKRNWNGYIGRDVDTGDTLGITYDFVTSPAFDIWGTRELQRERIANHITGLTMSDRIVVISGDMHALAFDDGYEHNGDGSYKLDGFGNKIKNRNNRATLKVCHSSPLTQIAPPAPYTFFQDPYTTNFMDEYVGDPVGSGFTGYAWSENAGLNTRGGPYYIGPLRSHTGRLSPEYDPDDPGYITYTSYAESYATMEVTDLGGTTIGFAFKGYLLDTFFSSAANHIAGLTHPETLVINKSWIVDLNS